MLFTLEQSKRLTSICLAGPSLVALVLAVTIASLANAQIGDGYADVVLDFYDSGNGPLAGPYGAIFTDFPDGYYPISVSTDVVLGGEPGPTGFEDLLSLPIYSYITLGFTDEAIVDGPGDDLSIIVPGGPGEEAEIYVSHNATDFTYLGSVTQGGCQICEADGTLDLASIGYSQPVTAVKVVSLSSGGESPGFDIFHVIVPPTSRARPIPEPTTAATALLALAQLSLCRTRRAGNRG